MTVLTLFADPDAPTATAELPMTVLPGGPDADLRAVDGRPGWAERATAAIAAGARGVLVARPCAESPAALEELAERSVGAPIVLDTRWRHNPVVAAAAGRLRALAGGTSLLEARAVVASGAEREDAMRDLAVLAQAVAGPIERLSAVGDWSARSVTVARMGGVEVQLTVEVTRVDAGTARVRALGADGGIDLRIPDAGTARAALLTSTDPSGCMLMPTRHESAHRAALRRLAATVRHATTVADLDEFRRVVTAERQP